MLVREFFFANMKKQALCLFFCSGCVKKTTSSTLFLFYSIYNEQGASMKIFPQLTPAWTKKVATCASHNGVKIVALVSFISLIYRGYLVSKTIDKIEEKETNSDFVEPSLTQHYIKQRRQLGALRLAYILLFATARLLLRGQENAMLLDQKFGTDSKVIGHKFTVIATAGLGFLP